MLEPKEFKYLYLDLNSYFASVEQQENPNLRGKPVAVVPMDTPHTCAIAASYEAKAYGVTTGTIIRDAMKMCPHLICVQARHDKYVDYHDRILSEVVKYTPLHKIWSIDEFDSILPPLKRNLESVTKIVKNIKDGLRNNIGEAVQCSIGIAPNSLLAKIATDMQKPDGFTVLTQDNLQERLFDLRLSDLPGIGNNMERRLHRSRITRVEHLWNLSPKHARKIWGSVQGERFWYWLHGYDIPVQQTNDRTMIGHSRVLDPNLRREDKARLMARRLLVKAVQRLRRQGLCSSRLSLGVRAVGQQWNETYKWRDDQSFSASSDSFYFLNQLDVLWGDMVQSLNEQGFARPLKFKKVSVVLSSLQKPEQVTGDLFENCVPERSAMHEKHAALNNALDYLQNKYRKDVITLGVPPKTLAGYVGTKISFSRVPDQEEFWE